jgi:tripeptide aminopeptidase
MKKFITMGSIILFLLTLLTGCVSRITLETYAGEFKTYDDIRTGVLERFLEYVTHDTQSDPYSDTAPSTSRQMAFAKLLADECRAIGLTDVTLCEFGIVMATLPANIEADIPIIGFIAHMDTHPDASGANVVPRIHENYDGTDIVLHHGTVISPDEFPALNNYIGQTIITASGDTLLGADDKAGIAIILTAVEYLIQNPDIPRGKIRIAFTPDEEIGRGTVNFDVAAFGADFAFTVDGGPLGELTYENFNAARAVIEIKGRSIHTGYAKGIMVNAGLIAAELSAALPSDERPVNTEGYEGFYHVDKIDGGVERATIEIMIRAFDDFEARKQFITDLVAGFNAQYGAGTVTLSITDQYYNMHEMIDPWIIDYAKTAFIAAGVEPYNVPTRGGTDGSILSYRGLPCPNIFTGMYNFHGHYEFVTLETMVKAVEAVIELCRG